MVDGGRPHAGRLLELSNSTSFRQTGKKLHEELGELDREAGRVGLNFLFRTAREVVAVGVVVPQCQEVGGNGAALLGELVGDSGSSRNSGERLGRSGPPFLTPPPTPPFHACRQPMAPNLKRAALKPESRPTRPSRNPPPGRASPASPDFRRFPEKFWLTGTLVLPNRHFWDSLGERALPYPGFGNRPASRTR